MKDVRHAGNVDQSRFPGYTPRRRLGRWLRALAGTCLAVTMAGGSTMVAGAITARASALVLAPNEPCSVLSAQAAGPKFCLKADPGNKWVRLTWSPSTPVGSVIVFDASPQGAGDNAAVTDVTDKGALVIGLTNKTPYTFWLVDPKDRKTKVSDPVPATPEQTPATVPGTPAGLTAVPGNHQVTLSWDPPAPDRRPKPSGYNVYQATSPGGVGTLVNSSPITSTSYPVTGLTNGSTYYFTVKAVTFSVIRVSRVANGVKEGQASCEVPATPVKTPATVPGPPAGLTAVPGAGQVTLSWDKPASDGGSQVSGYNVYQGTSPGGESDTPVNGGSPVTSTSYPVTGLTNGSTYYFTVKAVNAQGPGAASGEVPAVPLTVPEAPTGLTATPDDARVTLAWNPPASDGGSQVSRYRVYYATSDDFTGATEAPAVITGTVLVLVGLVNGTTYYFRVTAVNQAGEGQPSGGVPATPRTVPEAPAGLTATADNAKVTLSWKAPASDGGSPVERYNLYLGTTAHFTGRAPLAKVTGTAAVVTGLANGTTYYFRVTAVNQAGEGQPSNEVPATPLTVPEAPAGLTATPGDSKVTLSWNAPASGGAPINGYIIYQGTSPGGETGTPVNGSPVTDTSFTVTGLTNGTTYYFKVVAVNAAGLSPLSAEASAALPIPPPPPPSSPPPSSPPPSSPPPSSPPPSSPPPSSPPPSSGPAFTAPTQLTATAGDKKVHLSWNAPTSDGGSPVVGYKIYLAEAPGVQELPAAGTAKTTDATVAGLQNKAVYYFMVTAVNTAGNESPLSTEVSAKPAGSVPGQNVSLNRPAIPPQLIALLAAVGTIAAAAAFTLIGRLRRPRPPKRPRPERPDQQTPASNVRTETDTAPPDVSVHDTGQEPTHTIRLEPHPGITTTTIKEGRP
jgi:fibronectin type 3 domain-containing protein